MEFFLRYVKDRPIREITTNQTSKEQPRRQMEARLKIVISGLAFATVCLFIRCVDISYGTILRFTYKGAI